jgi:hypothetical protein
MQEIFFQYLPLVIMVNAALLAFSLRSALVPQPQKHD